MGRCQLYKEGPYHGFQQLQSLDVSCMIITVLTAMFITFLFSRLLSEVCDITSPAISSVTTFVLSKAGDTEVGGL